MGSRKQQSATSDVSNKHRSSSKHHSNNVSSSTNVSSSNNVRINKSNSSLKHDGNKHSRNSKKPVSSSSSRSFPYLVLLPCNLCPWS